MLEANETPFSATIRIVLNADEGSAASGYTYPRMSRMILCTAQSVDMLKPVYA